MRKTRQTRQIIKRSKSECLHSSERAQIAPRAQIYKICKAHRATAPCGVARKEYSLTKYYTKLFRQNGASDAEITLSKYLYYTNDQVMLVFGYAYKIKLDGKIVGHTCFDMYLNVVLTLI